MGRLGGGLKGCRFTGVGVGRVGRRGFMGWAFFFASVGLGGFCWITWGGGVSARVGTSVSICWQCGAAPIRALVVGLFGRL